MDVQPLGTDYLFINYEQMYLANFTFLNPRSEKTKFRISVE